MQRAQAVVFRAAGDCNRSSTSAAGSAAVPRAYQTASAASALAPRLGIPIWYGVILTVGYATMQTDTRRVSALTGKSSCGSTDSPELTDGTTMEAGCPFQLLLPLLLLLLLPLVLVLALKIVLVHLHLVLLL